MSALSVIGIPLVKVIIGRFPRLFAALSLLPLHKGLGGARGLYVMEARVTRKRERAFSQIRPTLSSGLQNLAVHPRTVEAVS